MFTKQWLKDEAISFIQTMLTFFAIDAVLALSAVYNGDWSTATFMQIGVALLRSVVKSILTMAFPKMFPQRASSAVQPTLPIE